MNLGKCMRCRQRAELHRGADGRMYCEDCLVMGGKDRELQLRDSDSLGEVKGGRREELLGYIAGHASKEWVSKFIGKYAKTLRDNYGWVRLIETEADELVLLRIATEIGYGRNERKQSGNGKEAGEEVEGAEGRGVRGGVKRGAHRVRAAQGS